MVAIASLAVLLMAATLWGNDGAASDRRRDEPPAPALYNGETTCSASGGVAEARAVEAERIALAKRERYAFDARDGVSALPLFQEAAACFRDAGRTEDAQRTSSEFAAFHERLSEDFSALRLELRTARSAKRYSEALRVTRELERLLSGRPSAAYSEWLASLHHEFEQKLAPSR